MSADDRQEETKVFRSGRSAHAKPDAEQAIQVGDTDPVQGKWPRKPGDHATLPASGTADSTSKPGPNAG